MKIDLHTHTAYSYDAQRSPLCEHVRAAVDAGVDVLGISEHVDFFHRETIRESDFRPGTVDFEAYSREVEPFRKGRCIMPDLAAQQRELEQCRRQYDGRILLRAGVEMGQPHAAPDLADRILETYRFDYVIGSIHHMPDDMDMYFLNYENLHQDEVLHAYFDEMDAMLRYGNFHILGHIDYPLRVMKLPHNHPSLKGYMDRVDTVLRRLVETGIALECNTKSLLGWQQAVGPEDFVLRRYRELGGEYVTVGSDSHSPDRIAYGIPQALGRLRELGFGYVTDFAGGKPIQHAL